MDQHHTGPGRKSKSGEKFDIEVLRNEYRNMQANRSAFAHDSDLVSNVCCFLFVD